MLKRTLKSKEGNPILSKLLSMMSLNRERLLEQLDGTTDEMIDYTPDMENIETIGTLLDHIAAVDWSWIFEDIDGMEMNYEKWKYAFALRKNSEVGQRLGQPISFYMERISKTRNKIINRLNQFSDEDLGSKFSTEDDMVEFSLEWVIFHLINHEAFHIGQISLLKRLYRIENDYRSSNI